MNDRQREILREMGLAPIWRLRVSLPGYQGPKIKSQACGAIVEGDGTRTRSKDAGAAESWIELKSAVAACTRCRLHAGRTQTVFGVGDERADWLLIGEGPGAEEDKRGEPFVGQAGKLLDNMLSAIGLKRGHNVYIANAVKCRPPGNRNPEKDELAACRAFLDRQIALISPKLIVLLGRIAAQTLLESEAAIARLRGRVHDYRGISVVVTYHPAYLLRNLPDKARAWEDLCLARRVMHEFE